MAEEEWIRDPQQSLAVVCMSHTPKGPQVRRPALEACTAWEEVARTPSLEVGTLTQFLEVSAWYHILTFYHILLVSSGHVQERPSYEKLLLKTSLLFSLSLLTDIGRRLTRESWMSRVVVLAARRLGRVAWMTKVVVLAAQRLGRDAWMSRVVVLAARRLDKQAWMSRVVVVVVLAAAGGVSLLY